MNCPLQHQVPDRNLLAVDQRHPQVHKLTDLRNGYLLKSGGFHDATRIKSCQNPNEMDKLCRLMRDCTPFKEGLMVPSYYV